MAKIFLLVALATFSAQAYAGGYGRSQLIDVARFADEMSLGSAGGSEIAGGIPAGLAGPISVSGGHSQHYDVGTIGSAEAAPLLAGPVSGGAVVSEGLADAVGLIDNTGRLVSGNGLAGGIAAPIDDGNFVGGNSGSLAILRNKKVAFVPVATTNNIPEPTNVFVDSHMSPVNMVVRSISHGINLEVKHIPSQGTFRQSESEDAPSRHVHTIRKPVIQEIREIIQPFRKVIQEVQPVQEEVITNIPRNAGPAPAGPGGIAFVGGAAAAIGRGPAPVALAGGCSGPSCLQRGFVPITAPIRAGGCSNRGGCAIAHKLAGPVVPAFGHAVGGGFAPASVPY